MSWKLAVTVVVTLSVCSSHAHVQAQVVGRPIGPTGGFGGVPIGHLGGPAGAAAPLRLKVEPLGLQSSLPNFQSPELQPAINAGMAGSTHEPSSSNMSSAGNAVPVYSGDVGETNISSQHREVSVIVHPPNRDEEEDDDDDDDDEEGDIPWWLWLLLSAGVSVVISRLRR
jgi:hypothetical protein